MEIKRGGRYGITTKDLIILAFLSAILFALQIALAPLPNIEIVSLLIYVYTQVYRRKAFFIIYVFALLEGLVYGFGLWWLGYLYVWSILAAAVLLLEKTKYSRSVLLCCVVLGAFGLSYGFLFALPYFGVLGVRGGMSYWISGLPFDLAHCGGNVVMGLFLYRPLRYLLGRLQAGAH